MTTDLIHVIEIPDRVLTIRSQIISIKLKSKDTCILPFTFFPYLLGKDSYCNIFLTVFILCAL